MGANVSPSNHPTSLACFFSTSQGYRNARGSERMPDATVAGFIILFYP
jgi:hypothetical protein